jgi:hypothetical protein
VTLGAIGRCFPFRRPDQAFDDHAVAPRPIELCVAAMHADLRKTEPLQQGTARDILGKDAARQLVEPGSLRRCDQRDKNRAPGALPATIAGDIDRELADARIARPRALGKGRCEGDNTCFCGFGEHDERTGPEPRGNLLRCARFGLEGRDPSAMPWL